MTDTRRALIFADLGTGVDHIVAILKEVELSALLPHELAGTADPVSIIIIERAALNAISIASNLRRQDDFKDVPLLVLLETADQDQMDQLTDLGADLLFKPVFPQALTRYLRTKTGSIADSTIEVSEEERRLHNDARRFARLLVSEIELYNGATIREGRSDGDLYDRLREDIERSRQMYDKRVAPPVAARQDYFHQELVNILAAGDPAKLGSSYPGSGVPLPSKSRKKTRGPAETETRLIEGNDQATESLAATTVLEDIIPNSNRLLPSAVAETTIAKGGVRCEQCDRWNVRREDAFCSKCGEPLIILKTPDRVVFEPSGEHRVGQLIELGNAGQNPLRMRFDVIADKELAERFSLHTESSSLDPGHAEHLLATFDARALDLTMRYQALLEVASNADGYSKQQIPLVVERLPIPRLVTDESYTYVLGVENEWAFRLVNDGGGTLHLTSLRLRDEQTDPSNPLVALELLDSVVVKGNQFASLRVRVPQLDLTPGKLSRKIDCEFEYHKPLEVDVGIHVIRPARLAVQPTELDFGVVSTHRSGKLSLTFFNGGGEELTIESITPSFDQLNCSVTTPFKIEPGNTVLVDVQITGSLESAGDQSGEIKVRSNSYGRADQSIPFVVKFVEPGPYEEYIGIDFGTTACCVAVLDKDDQAFIIPLDLVPPGSQSDPRIMPSVLFFQPDGSVIAGREALNDADIQPINAVTSIKRVLGSKQKRILAGREFDPTQLTAKIIEQLLLRTETALFELGQYKTPRRAIVTVPVEVFDNQRRALLEACRFVGLEMHSDSKHGVVIDEAHAAALYYLSKRAKVAASDKQRPGTNKQNRTTKKKSKQKNEAHQVPHPEHLFIFDFGGGTLDCALIEIEAAEEKVRLKTLAPGGDPKLGGDDIDWALVGLLADKAKEQYPEFDINCLGDETKFNHQFRVPEIARAAYKTRAHFKRQAEVAKIALGNAPAVELEIGPLLRVGASPLDSYIMNGAGTASLAVALKQEELEQVLAPFLIRATSVVQTICHRAKVKPKDIDTILHVGRTSLLPMVRKQINELLPNAEDRSELIEPKLCVALGAAFWGQIKDQPNANFEFVGGANGLIHDIGYVDFLTGLLQQVFVSVFPSQTEFPCETMIEFPLSREIITLQLAENRGNKKVIEGNPEVRRIGRVRIDTRGVEGTTISVKFAIDENRVLQITANGQTQNIELVDE